MKPIANAQGEPLTVDQMEDRVNAIDEQIYRKQNELRELQDSIPGLIAQHRGTDLAAVRERKQVREITEHLGELGRTRAVLHAQLDDAKAQARDAQIAENYKQSQAQAKRLHLEARELQSILKDVITRVGNLRAADESFCNGLHNPPQGFERMNLSVTLMRRIEIALYALSDGALRPRQMIENAYEIKQAGRHDIEQAAKEYTTVALRNRPRSPTEAA